MPNRPWKQRSGVAALCCALLPMPCTGTGDVTTDLARPCGNDGVDYHEVCDGDNLGGRTCENLGFGSGDLSCEDNCMQFDTSQCAPPAGPIGFGAESTAWAIPEPGTGALLEYGFTATSAGDAERYWSTFDITGDSRPDLVWTAEPWFDGEVYGGDIWGFGSGTPYWRVFINTGTGFSPTSIDWAMPPVDGAVPLDSGFNAASWHGAAQFWATFDIDGDGLADFVWTGEPALGASGYSANVWGLGSSSHYWRVFLGTGSGFSRTSIEWPVPRPDSAVLLDHGFNATYWRAAAQYWSTFDIDGDGRPDFVWTAEPTFADDLYSRQVWGYGDDPYWRVFLNTGTGFSSTAIEWPVPTFEGSFPLLYGFSYPHWLGGSQTWATFDINNDSRPEFVWTGEPKKVEDTFYYTDVWGMAEDNPHWLVYANTGSGFAAQPQQWPVPIADAVLGMGHGFNTSQRRNAGEFWTTTDLTGDGLVDLVWTAEPNVDPQTGFTFPLVWGFRSPQAYWKVYPSDGSGFSAFPILWNVPAVDSSVELAYGFCATSWEIGAAFWSTLDMDGTGGADFVWTAEPRLVDELYYGEVWGSGTQPHWRVFTNGN